MCFVYFTVVQLKKKKINLFPAIPEAHADPSMHSTEQPSGARTPPTASCCPWPASRGPGNPRLPAWGCCIFSPVSEPVFPTLTSSASAFRLSVTCACARAPAAPLQKKKQTKNKPYTPPRGIREQKKHQKSTSIFIFRNTLLIQ